MEYINRIELQGTVGQVRFSLEGKVAQFALLTQHALKDRTGAVRVESTWHSIAAFSGRQVNFKGLKTGAAVYVTGRLRNVEFTGEDGERRMVPEILASSLKTITTTNK